MKIVEMVSRTDTMGYPCMMDVCVMIATEMLSSEEFILSKDLVRVFNPLTC